MKSMLCILSATTALTMWSVVATAQQEQPQTSERGLESQMPSQAISAERDLSTGPIGDQRRASTIVGMDIRNTAGEELGTVDDLILDQDQRRIAYAIVSYGGILGFGESRFAVPWQAFSTENETVVLDMDKERLKTAPQLEKGELPDKSDPQFHEELHTFYGTEPYELEPRAQATEESDVLWDEDDASDEAATQQAQTEEESGWDWNFWSDRGSQEDWARRLSEVIGTEVVTPANEDLGKIEDVIIDMREGRLTYALIGYGGMEQQTAAVPWSVLNTDEQQEVYSLDATTEDLEIARLEENEIDRLEDEQFSRTIHEAFDTEPYWMAQQQDEFWQGSRPAPAGSQAQGQQVALSGTIESVRDVAQPAQPGQTPKTGVEVQLRTDAGETETVRLASRQELQQQNLQLSRGDELEVQGRRTTVQGQDVVEATRISKDGTTATFEPGQSAQQMQQPQSRAGQPQTTQRAQSLPQDPTSQPRAVAEQEREISESGRATQEMGETPEFSQAQVNLKGTVEQVEEFTRVGAGAAPGQTEPLGEGEEPAAGLHVQLQTDSGVEILHFSSAQELEDQNLDITQGSDIEITGYRTRYMGEPVIQVTEVTMDGQTVQLSEPSQEEMESSDPII